MIQLLSLPPARARRDRSRGSAGRRVLSVAGVLLALAVPAAASAHPLGNFTINHFAAVRVAPDRVALDVVIDRAEIPAFQEVQRLDADGDGTLTPTQLAAERVTACQSLAADLRLSVAGQPVAPVLIAAGLSTPPGAGGLPTMRLVCNYEAALAAPIGASTPVSFADGSFAERIGWREIVVLGDGLLVDGTTSPAAANGASGRLTAYPADLLAQPLDMRSIDVQVAPGGSALAPWTPPDAQPVAAAGSGMGASPVSAVPGGIGEELAALIDVRDLGPLAILLSLGIAFVLGIVHALSPGHGKTIMAAYLVAGRGTSRQAIGLGLAVAVSHTLGVLALAGITLAASSVLPPERLYPILGVASGGLVVAIGASLLWSRLRRRGDHDHGHEHAHGTDHGHADANDHGHDHPHDAHAHARSHGHPHPHSHGPADDRISWRGLIALGLSGGLVPSASALILLLGSIAVGQVAYGLVLVLAFGLGMSVVLTGIGLVIVHARALLARRPSTANLTRLAAPIQIATACLVVVLGVVLTGQALAQVL